MANRICKCGGAVWGHGLADPLMCDACIERSFRLQGCTEREIADYFINGVRPSPKAKPKSAPW